MKETSSRLIGLPFCWGCLSQSTTKSESNKVGVEGERSSSSMVEIKKSWTYVAPSRSNISKAMEKLIKVTLKSFANVFTYKGYEDIEIVTELEIGHPTDVKHITHIGHDDGSTTTNPNKILDHLQPSAATVLPLPSVSLKQFKLAMAAQAEGRNL